MELRLVVFLFGLMRINAHTRSCGRFLTENLSERVVNGYDVGYYKYPWFASLIRFGFFGESVFCGGVLISKRHVLTAAHCLKSFAHLPASQLRNTLRIQLGDYNACSASKSHVSNFSPQLISIHENYTTTTAGLLFFDIAIIQLNVTVTGFTPICLPSKWGDRLVPVYTPHTIEATVIGYGYTNYTSKELPCTLQEARVLINSNPKCRSLIATIVENNSTDPKNLATVLCAGYWTGKFDACAGDSGGPLQVLGPHNKIYLAGLVSFGFGCAEPNVLGFYTNVTSLMSWVHYHLGGSKDLDQSGFNPWGLFGGNNYFYWLYNSWFSYASNHNQAK